MPTYDYVCTACDNAWELEQRIVEPAVDTCPKCGKKTAKRQVSGGAGFILKGGGWYSDLYSSTSKSSKSSSSTSDSTSKPSNTETKSSDSSATSSSDSKTSSV